MSSTLLPERPLLISPTLASTIGLEEAVMLQVLADISEYRESCQRPVNPQLKWVRFGNEEIHKAFPFWAAIDVRRVQASLQNLGVIHIDSEGDDALFIAIEESVAKPASILEGVPGRGSEEVPEGIPAIKPVNKPATQVPAPSRAPGTGPASLIPVSWQPDDNWIRMCKQHSIPEQFIRDLVPEFVSYWRERGQARFSWGNAFYKHVLKEWRNEQTRRGAHELASTMSAEWRPSLDALEILENSGISPGFIEDAVPEFVLYWRERGVVHGAWNTKFIEHIRRQWAKYSASFGRDDTPRPIPADWQPSSDCYEILQLAEIDEDYARSRIPEFVMYWTDSQQVKASWNTTFLQFIKQDWARQLKQAEANDTNYAENQSLTGSNQQRVKEKFQRIADRSWAD